MVLTEAFIWYTNPTIMQFGLKLVKFDIKGQGQNNSQCVFLAKTMCAFALMYIYHLKVKITLKVLF